MTFDNLDFQRHVAESSGVIAISGVSFYAYLSSGVLFVDYKPGAEILVIKKR